MIYLVGTRSEAFDYAERNKLKLDGPSMNAKWIFHRGQFNGDLGKADALVVLPSATLWGARLSAIERRFEVTTGNGVTYVTEKPAKSS
jgi:hypothetical protein